MRSRNRIPDTRIVNRPDRTPQPDPCISLISAVVDKALSDVRAYADLVNGKRLGSDFYLDKCRKFAVGAWNWLQSDVPDERGRLTFCFCCEVMDMDPERIRSLLARLIGPTAVFRLNH